MAILTGYEIRRQMVLGAIKIDPMEDIRIGPNSVDLHLGDELLSYDSFEEMVCPNTGNRVNGVIDPKNMPQLYRHVRHARGGWLLIPGRLYLGFTKEYTETHGFVPYLDGRSSLGRLGVFAHVTAGRGDNGFKGNWTVELVATEPVLLYPGGRYFQITYHTVIGEQTTYTGRYQGDRGATGSRIDK